MIITVQCRTGAPGEKPTTTLKYSNSGPFSSIISSGDFYYGANTGGIWQLNYTGTDGTNTDDGLKISYRVVFNFSNFGSPFHNKKLRYVYFSGDNLSSAEVLTSADGENYNIWNCRRVNQRKGFRQSVYNGCQSLYWSIGIESAVRFTLLSADCSFITRPAGVSNG